MRLPIYAITIAVLILGIAASLTTMIPFLALALATLP